MRVAFLLDEKKVIFYEFSFYTDLLNLLKDNRIWGLINKNPFDILKSEADKSYYLQIDFQNEKQFKDYLSIYLSNGLLEFVFNNNFDFIEFDFKGERKNFKLGIKSDLMWGICWRDLIDKRNKILEIEFLKSKQIYKDKIFIDSIMGKLYVLFRFNY